MGTFNADTDRIISYSVEIINLARQLKYYNNDINNVSLAGCMGGPYGLALQSSIRRAANSVLVEAARMETMGKALRTIAEKYRAAEKANSGILNQGGSTRGTDKRNPGKKFIDWIRHKEPDAYDTTTREQERAADAAMKRRLWEVLQDEKYSPEHWDKASVEERQQILQDYVDEVIAIYGLQDVDRRIHWDNNATYTDSSITWGYYDHDDHSITLNERALTDSVSTWDSYDLLETVSHELRHAYQHEAVDHPTDYLVTAETIAAWDYNIDNYIDPDDDYDGYRDQIIEVDARDFQINRDSY